MTRLRLLALLAVGCAGCGGATPATTAPTPTPIVTAPPSPSSNDVPMAGTVSDAAFRPLAGARVEVLDGPQAGMIAATDSRGEFALSGAFDDQTRFKATKDGYAESIRFLSPICALCHPNRWVNFSLDTLAGSVDLTGDYLVTLDTACAALPGELRTRTYQATLSAAQQQTVPLSGATFVKGRDVLPMGVVSDYVAFWIEVLVEQLAPNAYLTVNALAATHVGNVPTSTFTFPLDGSIEYCVTTPDTGSYEDCFRNRAVQRVGCASGRLVFTRR